MRVCTIVFISQVRALQLRKVICIRSHKDLSPGLLSLHSYFQGCTQLALMNTPLKHSGRSYSDVLGSTKEE